jgi:predicted transglutaminase-like cysteine proteinase
MALLLLLIALVSPLAHAQATSDGWENYCWRTHDCSAGDPIPFAGDIAQLQRVNVSVNRAYRFQNDVIDDWRDASELGTGDCEDFALAKRARLVLQGWPRANLPIALTTRNGVAHAVLLARSNNRWYVLDQASSEVLPIEASPYRNWLLEPPRGRVWARLPVAGIAVAVPGSGVAR